MIASVDVRPAAMRAFRMSANLGDVSVVLRFRWLPRQVRWSLVVQTPDGEDLTPQLVVQSGGDVPFDSTLEGAPEGRLLWVGPETYRREDLGGNLRLLYDDAAGTTTSGGAS